MGNASGEARRKKVLAHAPYHSFYLTWHAPLRAGGTVKELCFLPAQLTLGVLSFVDFPMVEKASLSRRRLAVRCLPNAISTDAEGRQA